MTEVVSVEDNQYKVHHISCNKCGKHVYNATEYDDGRYYDPSKHVLKINIDGDWYCYRSNLCEECKTETNKLLIDLLTSYGFKKEQYNSKF